jgi:hypothetical protein
MPAQRRSVFLICWLYWKRCIPLDGGQIDLLAGYSGSTNGRNQFAASSIGTGEFEIAGIFLSGSKQEPVRDSSYWMRISRRRLRQQLYRHLKRHQIRRLALLKCWLDRYPHLCRHLKRHQSRIIGQKLLKIPEMNFCLNPERSRGR